MNEAFTISKENSMCIKGFLCIGILLHHLAQRTQLALLQPLCVMGAPFVAGFFFLSGYGLMAQLKQKGPSYLKGFTRRHFLKIALPYALITLLYALCYLALGKGVPFAAILRSLLSGDPFVPFSWYALAILFFYAAFAVSFGHAPSHSAGLWLCGFLLLCYMLICLALNYGEWWYLSSPAFLMGLAYAGKQRKHTLLLSLGALPLCAIALPLVYFSYFGTLDHSILKALCKMANICAVTAAFFSLLERFPLRQKALYWLGERSLFFYLLQGLPMHLLRNDRFYLASDGLYFILCLLFTLALAALAQYFSHLTLRLHAALTARHCKLPAPPPQS